MAGMLTGFDGTVDFDSQPSAAAAIQSIVDGQANGVPAADLVDFTSSEMLALHTSDSLQDLTPLLRRLQRTRHFDDALLRYGQFDTTAQYSIPWMQATYLMVVNKAALRYLPPGVDPRHLTYEDLIRWGQALRAGTGSNKIGLPAKPGGARGGLMY